ncbi:hypothetical protein [Streptomyces cacaoi]|uniref:hypothetical protein n=1 Tax=Streptomyces cacaoi TaxID=1898 RepID=UPI0016590529|nr:hypothetical protein [Streptomyces cacaoi]
MGQAGGRPLQGRLGGGDSTASPAHRPQGRTSFVEATEEAAKVIPLVLFARIPPFGRGDATMTTPTANTL